MYCLFAPSFAPLTHRPPSQVVSRRGRMRRYAQQSAAPLVSAAGHVSARLIHEVARGDADIGGDSENGAYASDMLNRRTV